MTIDLAQLSSEQKRALLVRKLAVARQRPSDHPLSFPQQRLWFLEQLTPDTGAYNVPVAVQLDGLIDIDLWRRCYEEIVRRHSSLRTTFTEVSGEPVQRVHPTGSIEMDLDDYSEEVVDDPKILVDRWLRQEISKPFDLERGPLWRVRFLRLTPERHVMVLTMHHIIADLWSMSVAIDELVALYRAYGRGEPSPLADLELQYTDYSRWQRESLADDGSAADQAYWARELEGAPSALDLPTDRPRPVVQTHRGASVPFDIPAELADQLRELAREHGATTFMALLAAFAAVLQYYSCQEEVVLGTPVANRNRPEIAPLIGFFVNTLALRVRLGGDPSFLELLDRVRSTSLGAFAHAQLPFEKLVEDLQPERDLSRSPIFQVSCAYQNIDLPELELDGVAVQPISISSVTSRFDLELQVFDRADGLHGWFEFNSDLFDDATIEGIAGALVRVVTNVTARPEARLTEIQWMDETERAALALEHNATEHGIDDLMLVPERIAAVVAARPTAEAVRCGQEALNYQELWQRADALAAELAFHGVGRGAFVGIHADRGVEMVVAVLAVLRSGAAFVPLDPGFPSDRLAYMVEDSGLQVVVSFSQAELPAAGQLTILSPSVQPSIVRSPLPSHPVEGTDPAYVIYTSGSSGRPKGVVVPHRALANFLRAMGERPGIQEQDSLLAVTTLCFDISLLELLLPLTAGARVVVADQESAKDGALVAEQLREHGITMMQATPSTWRMMLDTGWKPSRGLKVLCGGEAMTPDLAARLVAAGVELWNMYGPTETTIWSAVAHVVDDNITVGHPIDNTELHVIDAAGCLVPHGVPGELHIGGLGLALGYLGQPEMTAERFIEHPFPIGLGDRLYRTGDLVRRRADGEIEFLGRIDHQVKVRGFRIELGEIESLLEAQPQVSQAVVIVREDRPGDKRIVAYIRRAAVEAVDSTKLIDDWATIWDSAYLDDQGHGTQAFDTSGWNSSYTGEAIPAETMRDWLDGVVRTVLAEEPDSILDIGCGTGMLMHEVAGSCRLYWGTDISRVALDKVSRAAAGLPGGMQVELHQCAAHKLYELPPKTFDTVVINSVIQYFPDANYLTEVLEGALKRVSPGGHLVIGDVRSLPLLEDFHASIVWARREPQDDLATLAERTRQAVAQDPELALHPQFFLDLAARHGVGRADVVPKLTECDNEMSRFRYDVVLTVGEKTQPLSVETLEWAQLGGSQALLDHLSGTTSEVLLLSGVTNPRTRCFAALVEEMGEGSGSVEALETRLDALTLVDDQLDPTAVLQLAAAAGFRAEPDWRRHSAEGEYDVVLRRLGEDGRPLDDRLVAFPAQDRPRALANQIVRADEASLRRELDRVLRKKLPEYMVPSTIVFLDEFPRTPNNKVDRKALLAPVQAREVLTSEDLPVGALEEQLAVIWRDLLGVDELGRHSNFFALGGHSLLAAQIVGRTRKAFNVDISLRDLFENPTVAQFAEAVVRGPAERVSRRPVRHTSRSGDLPLSPAQEWLCTSGPELTAAEHAVVTAARLRGPLDVQRLQRALNALTLRHEALRLRLYRTPEGLVQRLSERAEWPIEVGQLVHGDDSEELAQVLREESCAGFDVASEAPLVRGRLLVLGPIEHLLVLVVHHAVIDNWSYQVVLHDLVQFYHELPGVGECERVDFTDIARWQRERLANGGWQRELEYWQGVFSALPTPPRLRPAAGAPEELAQAPSPSFALDRSLVEGLRGLAEQQGVSLFMVLLSVFDLVVAEATGAREFAVNFPTAGRDVEESQGVVGFLVNNLVHRAAVPTSGTFTEWLMVVRDNVLDCQASAVFPTSALPDELAMVRERVHLGFNLLSAPMPKASMRDLDIEPALPGRPYVYVRDDIRPSDTALSLVLTDQGQDLFGSWLHDPERVDPALVVRLASAWPQMLRQVVAEPQQPLSSLLIRISEVNA